MTPDDFGKECETNFPKAIDFPQAEYERSKDEFDRIAQQHGYRLAGFRLGQAVFSTKNS